MNKSDYKQLSVWQKSMDLAEDIHNFIMILPKEERFALCDQMRRCSISIPSNIAEGHRRNSNKEFNHFLSISKGSIAELDTQLLLCQRFRYADGETISFLCGKLIEIDKMLSSLMARVSNN